MIYQRGNLDIIRDYEIKKFVKKVLLNNVKMSKVVLKDLLVEAKPKRVARTTEPTVKVRLLLAVAVIFNSCTTLYVGTSY